MDNNIQIIAANWPASPSIKALATTRVGGYSKGQFASLNLAGHVGDSNAAVINNRELLSRSLSLPASIGWLKQVHGNQVLDFSEISADTVADGSYSNVPGQVCAVLTADCLPLLMCSQDGTEIAAVHVGWRGLCSDIILRAVKKFRCPRAEILTWLGPCISGEQYETGDDVRTAVIKLITTAETAFKPTRPGHWLMDLKLLAKTRLQSLGIKHIFNQEQCTYSEPDKFFSYRRDGQTGRFASMIWMDCHES